MNSTSMAGFFSKKQYAAIALNAFATACKSLKGSVDENTLVTAYTQRCAIHKTYARTFSKQHLLDKSRHL